MNAITTAGNAAGNAPALRVDGLSKRYGPGFALEDVTFDLPAGYIMGLIGPNGAGKSTLIRLILVMTSRDAGSIEVFGMDAVAIVAGAYALSVRIYRRKEL